jgi:hypothetical protein
VSDTSTQKDADVKASTFTPRQRRIVLLLVLIVVVVFALLAGFLIASLESLQLVTVAEPATLLPEATSPPASPTPAATSTPVPDEGIWPQVRAARLFDQIAHQVETDRALSPRAEVPLSFVDERKMEETLQEVHREGDLRSRVRPFVALGLLPDAAIEVQAQSPAGIYVTEQQQLYVAMDREENDPDTQTLLAHAYVHALQDQHFDLEAVKARARTTDERLAVQALIEGDATLTTALYSSGDLASTDWEGLTDLIVGAEHPRYGRALASCEAWTRLQRFPNQEGRAFAAAVWEHGGWEALNGCYTDLPQSTEQILHPSRYLGRHASTGQPDEPTVVVVPDLDPVLGDEWGFLLEDTLGEFAIGLHVNQVMGEESAWQVADGWDGDTLLVWERENGRRILVWRTFWDTSAEAVAFERGLTLLIPQHHVPARPIDAPRGLAGQWWETNSGAVNLRRTGRYVSLLRAPDTNTAINVARGLP